MENLLQTSKFTKIHFDNLQFLIFISNQYIKEILLMDSCVVIYGKTWQGRI